MTKKEVLNILESLSDAELLEVAQAAQALELERNTVSLKLVYVPNDDFYITVAVLARMAGCGHSHMTHHVLVAQNQPCTLKFRRNDEFEEGLEALRNLGVVLELNPDASADVEFLINPPASPTVCALPLMDDEPDRD